MLKLCWFFVGQSNGEKKYLKKKKLLHHQNKNKRKKNTRKTSLCNNIRTIKVEKQQEEKIDTIPLLLQQVRLLLELHAKTTSCDSKLSETS